MRKKSRFLAILLSLLLILNPLATMTHSGRTDSSGSHRNNKSKSGLGSYPTTMDILLIYTKTGSVHIKRNAF